MRHPLMEGSYPSIKIKFSWCLPWRLRLKEMIPISWEISCVLSHVWLLLTPWTIACQAPLSMGFSRQEYWSELPFPLQGIFLTLEIESVILASPALQDGFFTTKPPGKPWERYFWVLKLAIHLKVNVKSLSHVLLLGPDGL